MAYVPDFRGQSTETAMKMLEAAGLRGEIAPERFTELKKGSAVTLHVCADYLMGTEAPLVPDDEGKKC